MRRPGSVDLDQFDVEHQHAAGRPGLTLVRKVLRDPEPRAFAFDHQLHAFGPAFDHLVEPHRYRGAARYRTVEHLAVGGPARVVDHHFAKTIGMTEPGALAEHLVGEPRRGSTGVLRNLRDVWRRNRR